MNESNKNDLTKMEKIPRPIIPKIQPKKKMK